MKTRIYYVIASLAVSTAFILASCSDDDKQLPQIDGYNNSNEVAQSNLKAHWTFDDTNTERLSNTAPSNTYGSVGFADGQIGKALQLNGGALVFPSIADIGGANSLSNYTVSMWLNTKNTGNSFSTYFGIFPTNTGDVWGNINLSAETSWFPADRPVGDTLVLKVNHVYVREDGSVTNEDNRPDPKGNPPVGVLKTTGQWFHYVLRWNSSTQMLEIFANGAPIGAYSKRPNSGAFVMRTPAQAVFGSLSTLDIGFANAPPMGDWNPLATATIDDVRVFNTALADKEINALYNLGTAGR